MDWVDCFFGQGDSIMGKAKEEGIAATWDSNEVLIFCDLCIKEIGLGNRPTTHFSKDGWKNLIVSFKEQTGKSYDLLQMKNKWDHLKKDWKLWKELKHGETGLGWDPEKRTIAASDEWWTEKIKVVPATKKFRYGGITPELEEKLDYIFSQVVATGADSWAPSIGSMPPDVEHLAAGEDNIEEELEVQRFGREERNASTNMTNSATSSTKKRKMVKNKRIAISYMRELRESTLAMKPSPVVTIKEAVELISSINEIYDDLDLYFFAVNYIRDKSSREIFMSIPADTRVWWIKKCFASRNQ